MSQHWNFRVTHGLTKVTQPQCPRAALPGPTIPQRGLSCEHPPPGRLFTCRSAVTAWSLLKKHSVYCRQSGSPSSPSEKTKDTEERWAVTGAPWGQLPPPPTTLGRASGGHEGFRTDRHLVKERARLAFRCRLEAGTTTCVCSVCAGGRADCAPPLSTGRGERALSAPEATLCRTPGAGKDFGPQTSAAGTFLPTLLTQACSRC